MSIEKPVSISLINGMNFYFEDEGRLILAGGSFISGKEWVYVDGLEVFRKTNMSVSSNHHFEIDGVQYEIKILTSNILRGTFECSLIKNGVLLKKYSSYFKKGKTSYRLPIVLISLGFLLGILTPLLELPYWSLIPYVVFCFAVILIVDLNSRFKTLSWDETST